MTDPRLVVYVKAFTESHEGTLKQLREEHGTDAWMSVEAPPVTLVLPGMLVFGKPVSYLDYLRRVRNAIESIERDAPIASLFAEPDLPPEAEEDKPREYERIYLVDVSIACGGERFNLKQLSIQLSSVQGWTLGSM